MDQETSFVDLRAQAGLTVKQAAEVLKTSVSTIYRYQSGSTTPKPLALQYLSEMIQTNATLPTEQNFTFIDLFAGIGGLRKAFESAGGVCIFTSEWDRFAVQTYSANFQGIHPIVGDIAQVDPDEIPDHDVLVAGFPCQPFSLAGVSKKNSLGREHGFADEVNGTAFSHIRRILRAKRPKAFLLENVKNLMSHDSGNTFRVIMEVLESELDYKVSVKVIDAQRFLPQHRERTVIVGFREATQFSWDDIFLPEKGKHVMGEVLHKEGDPEGADGHRYTDPVDGKVNKKYTLSDKLWKYLQAYASRHKEKGNGFGYGLVNESGVARTLSGRYHKDGSEILVAQLNGVNPRRLTPRECARLMGFPEEFVIPVSDTQAYRQFGNSVAVPVFTTVARAMLPYIGSISSAQDAFQPRLPMIHL